MRKRSTLGRLFPLYRLLESVAKQSVVIAFAFCRRDAFLHRTHTRWNNAAGERRGDD